MRSKPHADPCQSAGAVLGNSYELSRPTALAVAMGQDLNLTLAFPDGADPIIVCGENRIAR